LAPTIEKKLNEGDIEGLQKHELMKIMDFKGANDDDFKEI